ncbi:DUF4097 family beta strand repeat-containing protein [Kribbella sp. NPDC051718]|uniref:DUF4097 family beta strand repeat-containing protein n=1 Tax=Kribbella sp. NPDC051718 TaxID=3155168 RepID=UPI00343FB07F
MRRGYAASAEGPITIDLGLFTQDGWIKVQAQADCTTAMIGLSTPEDDGPSATAVRDAVVESGPEGQLICTVHGAKGEAPVEITVVAPPGSTLIARTDNAHIGAAGLIDVQLTTASGDVFVPVAGRVFAETASGKVTVQQAGDVVVRTTSGDIVLNAVSGGITAKSSSGDIAIHATADGVVQAGTVSGDVTVTAAQGTNLSLTTSTVTGQVTTP